MFCIKFECLELSSSGRTILCFCFIWETVFSPVPLRLRGPGAGVATHHVQRVRLCNRYNSATGPTFVAGPIIPSVPKISSLSKTVQITKSMCTSSKYLKIHTSPSPTRKTNKRIRYARRLLKAICRIQAWSRQHG